MDKVILLILLISIHPPTIYKALHMILRRWSIEGLSEEEENNNYVCNMALGKSLSKKQQPNHKQFTILLYNNTYLFYPSV